MTMPTALEIARQATLKPITEIAEDIGIPPWLVEQHGEHVAKIDLKAIEELQDRPKAKYVVVTAITPTPLGEGKTTTTIGLGMAFRHIGRTATIAIRQASMGPTFGIKGGAAGGGYSQAVPFELLNLHLTGDMHAVTAAHNQIAAMVDNSLFRGNEFGLDLNQITWKRVLDVNDRALRNIVIGLGPAGDGVPRQAGFDITAASEVMAVLALAKDLRDLRARLGRIVVGYTQAGEPVTAEQLKAAGAAAVIMREALKPNLLQTLENTPVFVHAGPFGNIAHGNSSVVADLIGIHTGDFLVTEAGFGADMGAERFFNIKCRVSGLTPDAAVVVATVRALKTHSGKYRVVAGPPAARRHAGREPRRRRCSARPTCASSWRTSAPTASSRSSRSTRCRPTSRPSAPRSPRSPRRWASGPRSARTSPTAAAARPRSPRRSPRSPRRPSDFHFLYPADASLQAEDRGDRDQDLRRRRRRLRPARQPPARRLRTERVRNPPGLHRQDPVLAQPRRRPQGRADRLPAPGPRGPRLGRRRLHLPDLRRHAHHARPGRPPGRRLDRPRRRRQHRRPVLTNQRHNQLISNGPGRLSRRP